MPTIKDIAEHLGIAVSTVSKGLNGASDISEETRQLVLDTAVEMGYASKKIRSRTTTKVCVNVTLSIVPPSPSLTVSTSLFSLLSL